MPKKIGCRFRHYYVLLRLKKPSEMTMIDITGCLLPNSPEINADPNRRKFTVRPIEHSSSKCHRWTSITNTSKEMADVTEVAGPGPSSKKHESSTIISPSVISIKEQKTLTVSLDGTSHS